MHLIKPHKQLLLLSGWGSRSPGALYSYKLLFVLKADRPPLTGWFSVAKKQDRHATSPSRLHGWQMLDLWGEALTQSTLHEEPPAKSAGSGRESRWEAPAAEPRGGGSGRVAESALRSRAFLLWKLQPCMGNICLLDCPTNQCTALSL